MTRGTSIPLILVSPLALCIGAGCVEDRTDPESEAAQRSSIAVQLDEAIDEIEPFDAEAWQETQDKGEGNEEKSMVCAGDAPSCQAHLESVVPPNLQYLIHDGLFVLGSGEETCTLPPEKKCSDFAWAQDLDWVVQGSGEDTRCGCGCPVPEPPSCLDETPAFTDLHNKFGAGTWDNPHLIYFPAQLKNIQAGGCGKHYLQCQDLDLDHEEEFMINCGNNAFSGAYDGGGHTIHHFRLTDPAWEAFEDVGLFPRLRGDVRNLNLKDVVLQIGGAVTGRKVGVVCGRAFFDCVDIEDVHVTGELNVARSQYIGGVCGLVQDSGRIRGVSVEADLHIAQNDGPSGAPSVGGIAGAASSIEDTVFQGTLVIEGTAFAGGLVGTTTGELGAGVIRRVRSAGMIEVHESLSGISYIGGIAGTAVSGIEQAHSSMAMTVDGRVSLGGIAGQASRMTMHSVRFSGSVENDARESTIGGILGRFRATLGRASTLDTAVFEGHLVAPATAYAGGLVGEINGHGLAADQHYMIRDAYVSQAATILGGRAVGGAVGGVHHLPDANSVLLTRIYVEPAIVSTGQTPPFNSNFAGVGGLLGHGKVVPEWVFVLSPTVDLTLAVISLRVGPVVGRTNNPINGPLIGDHVYASGLVCTKAGGTCNTLGTPQNLWPILGLMTLTYSNGGAPWVWENGASSPPTLPSAGF